MKYGVGKEDLFQTNDLSEKKDFASVVNTLCALGRAVSRKCHASNMLYNKAFVMTPYRIS